MDSGASSSTAASAVATCVIIIGTHTSAAREVACLAAPCFDEQAGEPSVLHSLASTQ